MGNNPSGGHEPEHDEGCVTLAAKVAFLGRPDAYPENPMLVEVIETHLRGCS